MKNNRLIFITILTGVLVVFALIYYYTLQKNFTKNHREYLFNISKIENIQQDLNYIILNNSVYAYTDQDNIAKTIKTLKQSYIQLNNSKILKHKKYKQVKKDILSLEKKMDENINNIYRFMILNSGIKNSMLFLSRYIENANYIKNKKVYIEANTILKHFYEIKKMQDIDYLNDKSYLLSSTSNNKEIQYFIKNFNLHTSFLAKNYPIFLETTNNILTNNIHNNFHHIEQEFSVIVQDDFKALDTFAIALFSIFVVSFTMIAYLLYIYSKENILLLNTKKSLEHSITFDQLTNLYNRKALQDRLETTINPHLLVLDIDGFKDINDIYGNEVGNKLLILLAKLLKTKLHHFENIKIYRIGGNEFCVLFENTQDKIIDETVNMLEKFISKHIFEIDKLQINISVSIATNSIAPLLENTDLALKVVKHNPSIQTIKYVKELNLKSSVEENMKILDTIKEAINDDRIIPFFQPIINLKNSKIEKYEALVRLKQKDGTYLPPFKFLDISKKSKYYHKITTIMLEKTIAMAKEFPQYRFSLNISMIDILDEKFNQIFFDLFAKNILIASRIDIELLETEDLTDMKKVQDFIAKVHSYGSKILVDDFGTGYSNFSYFADLDIDTVKIDGSIVSEITTNKKKFHMLKSIYKFCKGMDMQNIAEFVESKEIALRLKEAGIKYAQGYYFSKPIIRPLDDDKVVI